MRRTRGWISDDEYHLWRTCRLPLAADLYRQRLAALAFPCQPVISVITPVHDTPPDMLDRMLRSVARQTYPFWEHCLVDDGSTSSWLAARLARFAEREPRIRFARRPANGGIVAASNDALRMARGTFIAMLDHDDELDPRALFEVASRLNTDPDVDIFYSDLDVIDRRGRHGSVTLLPDWSPDLLLSVPFLTHLTVFRRSLVEEMGGWRPGFDGSQDYDLALRAASRTDRVVHIPEILYHWRRWERSVAANPAAKPWAYTAGAAAIEDHLRRQGIHGRREDGDRLGWHTVRYDILGTPLVSIIAAPPAGADTNAASFVAAVRQLVRQAGYDRLELVIVSTPARSGALAAAAEEAGLTARVVVCESHDVWGAANAGAAAARGEHLVFVPAAIEPLEHGWLRALLEHSQRAPIGAVGSRLTDPDGSPWHMGVVVPRGVPHRVPFARLFLNCSAVIGIGMMTRRSTFEEAGGFRPASEVGYPDLDYCLRLRQRGYRHLAPLHAKLRLLDQPAEDIGPDPRFVTTWRAAMERDPYYNPNFCQDSGTFKLDLQRSWRGSGLRA